jgi:hypothetical protein
MKARSRRRQFPATAATQRRVMQYAPGTGFVLALFPAGFVLLATKASYSMAPTMVICVLAAYFTARLFAAEQRRNRFALSALVGFLIGLAVELPNLFLSSGYFVFFFVSFLVSVKLKQSFWASCSERYFWRGWRTLLANAINAGSAFSTTYRASDTVPPDFNFGII